MTNKYDSLSAHADAGRSETNHVQLVILVLFFFSGACGLIYEVVWMRMLTLVFGATAFAASTILAAFFAGLALGGFYFGRVVDKGRAPLRVYALLEAGVGAFAFLMPVLFAGLGELYVGVARHVDVGYYGISLVRFTFSFLVLLVPATLMGGTLPVMVKFLAHRQERLGSHVGRLYSINTFGAVVGTLAAGFFLILLLGVKETAYVAGVTNLLIAGTVMTLDRRWAGHRVPDGGPEQREKESEESGGQGRSSSVARLALWAIGLSGFCALALEVFWTRALVFFLDNSTHAFTTIVMAFLLGICIGSFIIAKWIDTGRGLLAWLGVVEVLIGVFVALAIPILNHSPTVFQSMAHVSLNPMLPWKWMGMRLVKSLAAMLLPTVLMGMAFPLAAKIYARNISMVGTALGTVYAVNTLGGVLGSVAAGFVLIPWLGVRHGILLIAVITVLLGGVLLASEPAMALRIKIRALAGLGLLFSGVGALYLTNGARTFTSYYEGIEGPEVLFYKEGIGGTVKAYRDRFGNKSLSVNGFPVAGTGLATQDPQLALAHLPLLLSHAPAPRVNIIGFGAGGTSWGVMQYNVKEVDCVELVPAVIDAAKWFPEINHGVLSQPKFNLILGDGRNYALVADKEYDVISVDATSPKMAGNGSLYALEFYELLNQRLSADGLVAQWVPFHLLPDQEVRMIAKTFLTVFPHTTLWFTPLRQYLVLVGTREKLEVDFESLGRKLGMKNVQQELELLNVTHPMDVLSLYVMGEEQIAKYVGDARINTDNHPYLEFTPALAYFVSDVYWLRNMVRLRQARESVLPSLVNMGRTREESAAVAERAQRRFEATQHSISGDMLLFLGRGEQAMVEYDRALQIDPQEEKWLNTIRLYGRRRR